MFHLLSLKHFHGCQETPWCRHSYTSLRSCCYSCQTMQVSSWLHIHESLFMILREPPNIYITFQSSVRMKLILICLYFNPDYCFFFHVIRYHIEIFPIVVGVSSYIVMLICCWASKNMQASKQIVTTKDDAADFSLTIYCSPFLQQLFLDE